VESAVPSTPAPWALRGAELQARGRGGNEPASKVFARESLAPRWLPDELIVTETHAPDSAGPPAMRPAELERWLELHAQSAEASSSR
jgi:hypothetical protein